MIFGKLGDDLRTFFRISLAISNHPCNIKNNEDSKTIDKKHK